MSELKDRIKNDTDMSNTEVNAANNIYRDDLEMAVFNARRRIEAIDGDAHTGGDHQPHSGHGPADNGELYRCVVTDGADHRRTGRTERAYCAAGGRTGRHIFIAAIHAHDFVGDSLRVTD